jgi:transposase
METLSFLRLRSAAQEDLRRKAVTAVLDGGEVKHTAKLFGITRQAVHNWLRLYHAEGEVALRAAKKGAPRTGGKLMPWQCAQVVRTISDKCPEQLKLPGFWLWTREAVQHYIKSYFDLDLSLSSVGRYLRRWGLTPQKPARRAYQRDARACKRWMDEEYPAIREQAKSEKATIFWGDECGFRSDHQVGTSYSKQGQTPVIPASGNRFTCNMVSAIDNSGRLYFKMFDGKFDAAVFIDFMGRLIRQSRCKVFLIVDNLRVHRSKEVEKWLAGRSRQIRIFFLPKYSPDLNPDEYLNNDVKSNAVGRRRAATKTELKANVSAYLRSTQRQPQIVKSFFQERHVKYAAV